MVCKLQSWFSKQRPIIWQITIHRLKAVQHKLIMENELIAMVSYISCSYLFQEYVYTSRAICEFVNQMFNFFSGVLKKVETLFQSILLLRMLQSGLKFYKVMRCYGLDSETIMYVLLGILLIQNNILLKDHHHKTLKCTSFHWIVWHIAKLELILYVLYRIHY